jgi:hypothetical protein
MPTEGDHSQCLTKEDLRAVWEALTKIQETITSSETLRKENAPKIDELITLLTVSKGILTVTKGLFFIAAPIGALIYWIKDHVKL